MATTFALGLVLALNPNEPTMHFKRIHRSLLIIPYAMPIFITALMWRGFFNTSAGMINTKLAVLTGVLGTLMCALAAYSFSRFRFKGRRAGLLGILLIRMFPQTLSMVAIYALLFTISLFFPWAGLNSHLGLLMVYLGGALGFNTWLMKGYFDSLPYSLEDSARVDGASHFQAFVRIILPLVRPILVVVFILIIVMVYGDFLLASILLQGREQYTLAVGLQTFITGNYGQRWGIFATAALIGAVPIVVFFLALQDQLVSGLTSGSSKE
ncbi:MAG: ABC transporter permease subunit [bacterium]